MRMSVRTAAAAACVLACVADPAPAQDTAPTAVIDTVIIERANVFTEEEAASSGIFRVMNSIHIVTQDWVIRGFLQFEEGEPFDSAKVAESERQLRLRRLFRELSMDSVRLEDGRLGVRVRSQDGWSLKPKFKFAIASTGDCCRPASPSVLQNVFILANLRPRVAPNATGTRGWLLISNKP